MNLKKIGKLFISKPVRIRPSSYEKKNLPDRGLTKVEKHWLTELVLCHIVNGYGSSVSIVNKL